jgi:hypothetical protein
MTFRSSMLVTLTAAVLAIGWVAAVADTDAPGVPGPPASAPATSPPPPSAGCATHSAALDRKVCADLPLSGNDDTAAARIPLRPGGFGR